MSGMACWKPGGQRNVYKHPFKGLRTIGHLPGGGDHHESDRALIRGAVTPRTGRLGRRPLSLVSL